MKLEDLGAPAPSSAYTDTQRLDWMEKKLAQDRAAGLPSDEFPWGTVRQTIDHGMRLDA